VVEGGNTFLIKFDIEAHPILGVGEQSRYVRKSSSPLWMAFPFESEYGLVVRFRQSEWIKAFRNP
jgi:hypothetical protein